MSKKIILLILFSILVIAGIFRCYNLGNVPVSADWDEASLGYNAYSLLQTGKDEYGAFMPVVLRSFDDYKPATYAYLVIPSIKIFGLSIFAVRFPSAILGVFTVLLTFFITEELFRKKENDNYAEVIGLVAAGFMAISPFAIQFSRIGFESNAAVFFNALAILCFLKGLKKPWLLSFAALAADISLYTYQSEKVFIPLLALLLIFLYRKSLKSIGKKYLIVSIVVGVIVAIPLLQFSLTNKTALSRAQGVSIFSNPNPSLEKSPMRMLQDKKNNDYIGIIFDNQKITYGKIILANYLSHFNQNYLFITGDNNGRHNPPFMGHLYLFSLPFLLFGIYFLITGNFDRKTKFFLIGWILITPIPAAFTWDVPNAVRVLNFLPALEIFIALGVIKIYLLTKDFFATHNKKFRFLHYFTLLIVGGIFAFNVAYFIDQYFVQYNYFSSEDWQYGYKETVMKVKSVENSYKKIVVSNVSPLDQSYIFFLFYLQYPPSLYQVQENASHDFGKYVFRPINFSEEKEKNILYIIRGGLEIPKNARVLQTVDFLDGKPAQKIITL